MQAVLVGFEDGDELHYGVYADAHRVEVEDLWVFLGVDFVETFLEHFGLLEVRFFACVLAPGEEYV